LSGSCRSLASTPLGAARPIELSIITQPVLAEWVYPPNIELQYGESKRAEFEKGELPDWPHPDPDVVLLVETARRSAIPLFGPPAAVVLEAMPHSHLVRAMLDSVPVLMPGIEEGDDRRNGLLTLARIWTTLATGEIKPKDAAADWALAHLPDELRPVLAHARAAYLGEAREDWRELGPRVRPHIDYIVERITALTAST
jgi:Domain of unknown function (DUF4111)